MRGKAARKEKVESECRNSYIYIYALILYGQFWNTCLQQAFPQKPTAQPSALLPWKFKDYRQRMLIKPLHTLSCRFHGISKQRSLYLFYLLFSHIIFYTQTQLNIFGELSLSWSDRKPEQTSPFCLFFGASNTYLGTKSPTLPSNLDFYSTSKDVTRGQTPVPPQTHGHSCCLPLCLGSHKAVGITWSCHIFGTKPSASQETQER